MMGKNRSALKTNQLMMLIVMLVSVAFIVACGGGAAEAPAAQQEAAPAATEAPAQAATEAPAPVAEAPTEAPAPAESPTEAPAPTEEPAPEEPTIITIAFPGDISTLDPHGSALIVVQVYWNQVFEALVRKNPDTMEMEPRLATSWEWENDTTMVINLREGVTWHDGTPFTAEDVKFSLERYRDKAAYGGRIKSLQTVEIVSDTQVKMIMSNYHAGLMDALGQAAMLQAGHEDEWYKENVVGTGPFKFVEWRTGDQIILTKNEDYWVEDEPKADGLVFKVIPELQSRISSLLAGDVDMLYDLDFREVDRLRNSPDIQVIVTDKGDFVYSIYTNSVRPGLSDPRVRQAVWLAVDRQAYIEQFQAGLAILTNSALGPSHEYYNRELDGQFGYDLEKAAQLLAEAGYPNGEGLSFDIVFPAGYADLRAGSELMAAGLSDLGITVNLEELELAAWSTRLVADRDFDLGWDIRRNALDDPAVQYGTTGGFQPGEKNRTGLLWETNPELTAALETGERSADPAVRREAYDTVQRIWSEGPWIIPVAVKPMSYAYRSDITGIIPQHAGHYLDFRQLDRN